MNNPLPDEQPRLPTIVGALAHAVEKVLSPGDVAELRRLRPDDVSSAAFWRVAATYLAAVLPDYEPARERAEQQWAVVLQALAELRGLHAPSARLGRALASAGLAESRLLRLLRASGESLHDTVRVTSHHLASTATPADVAEIAALVLSDGRSDEERVRRRIARDYYVQLEKKEKEVA